MTLSINFWLILEIRPLLLKINNVTTISNYHNKLFLTTVFDLISMNWVHVSKYYITNN